jgi:hypothetical protein
MAGTSLPPMELLPLYVTKQEIDEGWEIFEYVITMAKREQRLG